MKRFSEFGKNFITYSIEEEKDDFWDNEKEKVLNYMGKGVYKRKNEENEENVKINEEKIKKQINTKKRISKRSKNLFVSKKQKIIFKIKRLKKILEKKIK